MKTIFRLMMLALFLGGWGLAAGALYVVRTPDHFIIVPKDRMGLTDTYVDTRKWTLTDVSKHPVVVMRLIQLGRSTMLAHVAENQHGDFDKLLIDAVNHPQSGASPILDGVKADLHSATQSVKQFFN